MSRDIAHAGERAKYQLRPSSVDASQFLQPVDIDNGGRRFGVELHQIVKAGTACQEARARYPGFNFANGISSGFDTSVGEGPRDSSLPHSGRGVLDGGDNANIGATAA